LEYQTGKPDKEIFYCVGQKGEPAFCGSFELISGEDVTSLTLLCKFSKSPVNVGGLVLLGGGGGGVGSWVGMVSGWVGMDNSQ